MIMPILEVRNIDASSSFYQDVLGFTETLRMPGEDGSANFAIVGRGDMVQIGLNLNGELNERGRGVLLMAYVGDDTDMDAFYADVVGKGTPILEELKTEYWGDQLFTVRDPDGYVITMCKTVKQMTSEEILTSHSKRQ